MSMDTELRHDFLAANLRNIVECGYCRRMRMASPSSRYRRVNRSTGDYYYLDQRHAHHDQRSTVPVWLIHLLVARSLELVHHDFESLKGRARSIERYKTQYPAQDLLEDLLASRRYSIEDLNHSEIHRKDKLIELEILRQREEDCLTVAIFGGSLLGLEVGFLTPKTDEEFENFVPKIIPLITVNDGSVSIWTVLGLVYTFQIPDKPDKNSQDRDFPMQTCDVWARFKSEQERVHMLGRGANGSSLTAEFLYGTHLSEVTRRD